MTRFAPIAAALLAAGCAPSPHPHAAADPSPPARLYVYRPERGTSSPRKPLPVTVDGRPLALLGRDQFVSVQLPAGEHRLGVPGRPMRIALEGSHTSYCRVSAAPNQVVLSWDVRCSDDRGQHLDLDGCGRAELDPSVDWQP